MDFKDFKIGENIMVYSKVVRIYDLWKLNKEFCSSNGMKKYSLSSLIPISLASLEIFICLPNIKILGFSNITRISEKLNDWFWSITNWSTDLGNILYIFVINMIIFIWKMIVKKTKIKTWDTIFKLKIFINILMLSTFSLYKI